MVHIFGQDKKEYNIGHYNFSSSHNPKELIGILSLCETKQNGMSFAPVVQAKTPDGKTLQVAQVPMPGPEFHLLWIAVAEAMEIQETEFASRIESLEDRIASLEAALAESGDE
jgi:hypothetical protein